MSASEISHVSSAETSSVLTIANFVQESGELLSVLY